MSVVIIATISMVVTPVEFQFEYAIMHILILTPAWLGSARGRFWSKLAFPFWFIGILYIHQVLFIDYRLEPVHIADLYRMEQAWFGIDSGSGRIILSEWFSTHNHPLMDFFTGLAYILYLYQPFLTFCLFFFIQLQRASRLSIAYLIVNLMGIVTYFIYPAAPPWYVTDYGFGPALLDVLPSTAGAARFDALVGFSYFEAFYARNPNVFGAVPSLHAAYPMVVFLCTYGMGKIWSVSTLSFALLVGFSAVYLQHHYLIDVLVGYSYAGIAVGGAMWLNRRQARA